MNVFMRDLTGEKFGKLVVINFDGLKLNGKKHTRKNRYWSCKCECGKEVSIVEKSLLFGSSQSCGCGRIDGVRRKYSEIPTKNIIVNCIYGRYKMDAKRRKLDFTLNKEDISELIFEDCYYCGNSPSNIRKYGMAHRGDAYYTGLDRVNNGEGYHRSNVVPCCKHCNYAKAELTTDEFIEWHMKLHESLVQKGLIS